MLHNDATLTPGEAGTEGSVQSFKRKRLSQSTQKHSNAIRYLKIHEIRRKHGQSEMLNI